jgi:glycosyltransferase involved in cell wall biosynthesis
VRDALVAAGLDARRVVSIPTAVDLDRFAPRERDGALAASLGLAPDALVVGNVSSLHERKGIDTLLRAFALLAQGPYGARLRLLLVGPVRPQWPALARELGLEERVRFPGFREDVPELLSLFDVYALPSHHEALGTGALEAMAAGRARVAGAVEGRAAAVADTGVRVAPGDPQGLAGAIAALLDDPARRAALGAAARARAVAEYGAQALAAHMLALYEEVLAPRARPAERVRSAAAPSA